MLAFHLLIAFSSVIATGLAYLFPTKKKLFVTYFLVGMTLLTGSMLLISKPSHLVSACFEGLIYLGFMAGGIFSVHQKLSKNKTE